MRKHWLWTMGDSPTRQDRCRLWMNEITNSRVYGKWCSALNAMSYCIRTFVGLIPSILPILLLIIEIWRQFHLLYVKHDRSRNPYIENGYGRLGLVVTDALQRKPLMQLFPHDGSLFSITLVKNPWAMGWIKAGSLPTTLAPWSTVSSSSD